MVEKKDDKKDPVFEVPEEEGAAGAGSGAATGVALLDESGLREKGWTDEEIATAREQGILKPPSANGKDKDGKDKDKGGQGDDRDKAAAAGAGDDKGGEGKDGAGAQDQDKGEKGKDSKNKGTTQDPWKLSDEDEAKIRGVLGDKHPIIGVYSRMRSEARKRQTVQALLEEANLNFEQASSEIKRLKEENEKLKAAASAGGKDKDGKGEEDPLEELLKEGEGEGAGQGKDGKKKPLTIEDLEKREAEKAEAEERRRAESALKQKRLKVRLAAFSADARERFEDYDRVSELAEEVMLDIQKGKDSELFKDDPDKMELAQVRAERFARAVVNALDWKNGEKTPAELFYEIGKLHPKFNDSGQGPEEAVPAENGRHIAERIEKATERSSASVSSGSRRVVSEKDMTLAQYLALPKHEQDRVSDATRERLLRQ